MAANLIDGKLISTQIKDELKEEVAESRRFPEQLLLIGIQMWWQMQQRL